MKSLANAIDALNEWAGALAAWLLMALVVLQFALVVLRYVFSFSHPAFSESVWYLHGLLFTLAAGYTALADGHVRIDVFYERLPPKTRAAINLAGIVALLLPLCAVTLWYSYRYVLNAWAVFEGSAEIAGLPLIFALKTAIWAFAILLGLQGVSIAIKNYLVITRSPMSQA